MYHIPDTFGQCISILFSIAFYLALLHTPPLEIAHYIANSLIRDVLYILSFPIPVFVPICNCIISQIMPTNSVWTSAYSTEKETSVIMTNLRAKIPLDQLFLSSLSFSYRQVLATDRMQILNGPLFFLEHVDIFQNILCRIVIPLSLSRDIFSIFHASPSAGYMGLYKILYRLNFGSSD